MELTIVKGREEREWGKRDTSVSVMRKEQCDDVINEE